MKLEAYFVAHWTAISLGFGIGRVRKGVYDASVSFLFWTFGLQLVKIELKGIDADDQPLS